MDRMTTKIRTIASLAELEGYEAEAKRRGVHPEEMRALEAVRQDLNKQAKGGRKWRR